MEPAALNFEYLYNRVVTEMWQIAHREIIPRRTHHFGDFGAGGLNGGDGGRDGFMERGRVPKVSGRA